MTMVKQRLAQDVILRPVVSEKSYARMGEKTYQFEVADDANKATIKLAIEKIFKVRVQKVTTINVKGKAKRLGVHRGRTAGWKKATVTLHPDDTITIFEGMS